MAPAWLTSTFLLGLLSGFLSAAPVGPINTTILNEGGRRGFRWALLLGLGATVMEAIYCAVAFAGFSGLLRSRAATTLLQGLSIPLLVILGIRYLRLHDVPRLGRTARLVEEKLHPHTAFMTGFLRLAANPGVLVFWVAVASVFVAHGWIADSASGKTVCVAGIVCGVFLWFLLLGWAATHAHRRLSTRSLVLLSHLSGIVLLLAAVALVVRLLRLWL